MSVFSELDNMVLRSASNPPMTTKGSELTFEEMDARIIAMYDVVQSIVSGANVTAYDAGTTYDKFDTDIRSRYVSYNSRIWEASYNGSPSTFSGQTPEEGVYWTQVSFADLMPNILELARVSQNLTPQLNPCPTYCAQVTIPSAEVLQLNSTPKTIVPAQGAGTVIEVLSAAVQLDFNTTAYGTSAVILLKTTGANNRQAEASVLDATVSTIRNFTTLQATAATDVQMVTNADLTVEAKTNNPTAGDSDITVYVLYRIINV